MKKYFAKYLPVEGEIKEGELRLDLLSDEVFKTGPHLDKMPDLIKSASVPVKLFLCSRDIQVGDRYYHDEFCPYPNGEVADSNSKVMDAHMMVANESEHYEGDWSFKVIGEISPDALSYVKEGDVFDDEDIQLTTHWRYREDWRTVYRTAINTITGETKQVRPYSSSFGPAMWNVIDPLPEDIVFKIKGPCGHFH